MPISNDLIIPLGINALFETIEYAQHLAIQWLWTYSNKQQHIAIGSVPPRQLLKAVLPLLLTSVIFGGGLHYPRIIAKIFYQSPYI